MSARGRRSAFLRYGWAAPATLVGLAVSALTWATGARARVVDGCLEVAGGPIPACLAMLPRPWRFSAITFGHVIIGIDHETLAAVRCHEQIHVRQYERYGILFFPLYLGSSLAQIALGRRPYHDNHFEREARAQSEG